LCTAALVLCGSEGLLRAAGFRPFIERHDLFVGLATRLPLFVQTRAPDGSLWLETAPNKLRFFNAQRFPKAKGEGARRIFCLGGSTTYGHPYDDRTSFCGWLRALLPHVEPGTRWEVVNAGGISYASYRIADLMGELDAYAPDLFLVYTGHNEFLESRSYASPWLSHPLAQRAVIAAASTRVFSLLPVALEALASRAPLAPNRSAGLLSAEVDAVLDRSVGPAAYTRDDAQRARVLEHFRFNLVRMVRRATASGAAIAFITPASNLSDCSPFRSQTGADLRAAEGARFAGLLEQAGVAQDAGRLADAEAALRQALAIDPRFADAHYRLGRVLQARGATADAYDSFVRAREEDVCPLRAPIQIEAITREVARAEGTVLVDFAARVRERAAREQGSPAAGARYFLDHLHPTIDQHRSLALDVIAALAERGLLRPAPTWGADAIRAVAAQVEASLDRQRHGIALRNLAKVFSWAGKLEDAARMAALALRELGDDAESLFILGAHALERERMQDAIAQFSRALALDPGYARAHANLAIALARSGASGLALAHYAEAIRLDPRGANAWFNRAGLRLREGDAAGAAADYRRALELDPDDGAARRELAEALRQTGQPPAARLE
jgi:tetratricopeptide (TPR) repeat protein